VPVAIRDGVKVNKVKSPGLTLVENLVFYDGSLVSNTIKHPHVPLHQYSDFIRTKLEFQICPNPNFVPDTYKREEETVKESIHTNERLLHCRNVTLLHPSYEFDFQLF
jgi:hypothetical protein